MSSSSRHLSALAFPFVLALAGSGCSGGDAGPGVQGEGVVGAFLVTMNSDFTPVVATISGAVNNAPANDLVVWEQAAKEGSCVLQKPRVPFCSTPCGSGNQCVEDDTCKPEAVGKDIGAVTVKGVKTAAGATEVALTSTLPGGYGTATALAYPPFTEGDDVSYEVAAGGPYGAFSAHTKAIAELVVPKAAIPMEKDKALQLTWNAKGAAGTSTIHVHLDISHHGGTKGQIECDAADSGTLAIAAPLVTQLINLGVSGFPTVRLTRSSVGSAKVALGTIELRAEQSAERAIVVPGIVSCTGDEECPTGQTCQADLQCK